VRIFFPAENTSDSTDQDPQTNAAQTPAEKSILPPPTTTKTTTANGSTLRQKLVTKASKSARIFRTGLADFVVGYLHTMLGGYMGKHMRKGGIAFEFVALFVRVVCFMLPLSRACIPGCSHDAQLLSLDHVHISSNKKVAKNKASERDTKSDHDSEHKNDSGKRGLPVLIFSHGLTGTSDEHGIMATLLAQQGNVVALVHHCDGSSALADICMPSDGNAAGGGVGMGMVHKKKGVSYLYYDHPAQSKEMYDVKFRQTQVEKRADEVEGTRRMLLEGKFGRDLANVVDRDRCVYTWLNVCVCMYACLHVSGETWRMWLTGIGVFIRG
jgi:hypothetical protein